MYAHAIRGDDCNKPIKVNKYGSNILFFCSYVVWLSFFILNSSLYAVHIETILPFINILCTLMLILSEIAQMERYTLVSIGACCAVAILAAAFYNSDRIGHLVGVFFVICSRNIDFKRIAKISLIVIAAMFFFIVFSSHIGVIENYIANASGRMREYLGFRYSLYPARYALIITCLYIYIRGEKCGIVDCTLLFLFNYLIYNFDKSRLSFILSIVVIVTWFLIKDRKFKYNSKALKMIISSAFLIAAMISLLLTVFFDNSIQWMHELNLGPMLAGRLSMGQHAFNVYGISIIGQTIVTTGLGLSVSGQIPSYDQYFYIDCLYVELMVRYGLLAFALFICSQTILLSKLWESRQSSLILIIIVISVYCMIDNLAILPAYNPFLLLTGQLLLVDDSLNLKYKQLSSNECREQENILGY